MGDPLAVQEHGGGVDPCRLTSGWGDVCVLGPTLGDALRSLLRVRLLLRQRFCKTAELSKAEVAGKRNLIGYCRGSACAGSSSSSSSPVSSVLRLWVSPGGAYFWQMAQNPRSLLRNLERWEEQPWVQPVSRGLGNRHQTSTPAGAFAAPHREKHKARKQQLAFRFRPTPQVSSSLHPLKKAAAGACRGVL